jgi:hypothetical protein
LEEGFIREEEGFIGEEEGQRRFGMKKWERKGEGSRVRREKWGRKRKKMKEKMEFRMGLRKCIWNGGILGDGRRSRTT